MDHIFGIMILQNFSYNQFVKKMPFDIYKKVYTSLKHSLNWCLNSSKSNFLRKITIEFQFFCHGMFVPRKLAWEVNEPCVKF